VNSSSSIIEKGPLRLGEKADKIGNLFQASSRDLVKTSKETIVDLEKKTE